MDWLVYRMTYLIRSPVHIGFHKLGMIQRTRLFVPGKAIWGAVTCRLTRMLYGQPKPSDYVTVGVMLREHCRFTYFFPALLPDQPLLPLWGEEGLRYKNRNGEDQFSEDELAHRLVSSYASTAVSPYSGGAEEATLHEIEFLAPRRLDDGGPVFLIGYVFIARGDALFSENNGVRMVNYDSDVQFFANGMPVRFFGSVLQELEIGGEKTYGWGRVKAGARNTRVVHLRNERLWDRFQVTFSGTDVQLSLGDRGSPGGIETRPEDFPRWHGCLEPCVGRDWDLYLGRGAGRLTTVKPVIISPGAKWCTQQAEPVLILGPEGVLTAKTE